MIARKISLLLVLGLVLCAVLATTAHTQDEQDAAIIEEDYRVTTVEDRQRVVADLLSRADQLRNSGQLIEAARTLNRVGRFQIRMFVADQAVATFQQALQLLEQQPDAKTHIDSLNGLASSYDYLSKCPLAEPPANEAINLSKQHNYVAGQAEALLTLSDCQNHRDHALALRSAQESLDLWRSINRKRGIAEAHVVIGHYQLAQANLEECNTNMQAALDLYRELNDRTHQASILIYLAMIEYRKGAWQNSLALYTQAQFMIDEKAEPYKMGQIASGLGDAFLESGMPDVALQKFREAQEHFRTTKNERAVAILHWYIGRTQFLQGNYQEALDNLHTSRNDSQSRNDVTLMAHCDDYLGRTYAAQDQQAAALNHFKAAREGYAKTRSPMERARTIALMGQELEKQGDHQSARASYSEALQTFQKLSDRLNESATLHALGKLELKDGHLELAEGYLRRSLEATENIRRISTSNDLTVAFSAAVYDRYQSYVECLMQKHKAHPDQNFDRQAFEISELARARSLHELLRATETSFAPGVDPKLVAREKSLRQSLRIKEDHKIAMLGQDYSGIL